MDFIFGAVLVTAGIALLGAARFAVTHLEDSSLVRKYAATEITALIITTLWALGIGFLAAGLASGDTATGLVEFGAALGVIVLSAIAVIRLTRRPAKAKPATFDAAKA